MIIALVNSKGGVGKSTLAGNLVGWLHEHGRSVILADCDTQSSSSEWIREALPQVHVVRFSNADEVLDELRDDPLVINGIGKQFPFSGWAFSRHRRLPRYELAVHLGRFAPYFERPWRRSVTPTESRVPRTTW